MSVFSRPTPPLPYSGSATYDYTHKDWNALLNRVLFFESCYDNNDTLNIDGECALQAGTPTPFGYQIYMYACEEGKVMPDALLTAKYFAAYPPSMPPKCECGAHALGVKNKEAGHSSWCPVRA